MVNLDELRTRFAERFDGSPPTHLARAPGRINLIGEHTDYNEGLCLPAACARDIRVAARRRADGLFRAYSAHFDQQATLDLGGGAVPESAPWTAYVAGVALLLGERDVGQGGADLLIESDLRPGGGLASSAALEVACAQALVAVHEAELPDEELIRLCVRAEHEYAHAPCGVMDQLTAVRGRAGCALLLDCRRESVQYVSAPPPGTQLVLIDTQLAHENRAGEYARRRIECQEAVAVFRAVDDSVRSLRDASPEILQRCRSAMDNTLAARARHVVGENERVRQAVDALRAGDAVRVGRLMSESHRSLRDNYAVSCAELDALVAIAEKTDGVLGARLMGAGLGGGVLVLCRPAAVEQLRSAVGRDYDAVHSLPALVTSVNIGGGAACHRL